MTGDQLLGVAAVIAAIGGLTISITTSIMQVRAVNRSTEVAKRVAEEVQELTPALKETSEKVSSVHVLTNSNFGEQKEKIAELQAKLEELTKQRDESALLALEAVRHQLAEAQREVSDLRAAQAKS